MEHIELVVLFLLVTVAALTSLARLLGVPYPIVLVIGGSLVGFAPGVPDVLLEPDLVLLIFLPPLLFNAAYTSSIRELRSSLRAIALTSIGLVLLTTCSVALVAHAVDRRAAVGRRVRARRDRVADRPARRHSDHAPAGRAAAADRGHRGREPGQRRHRAGGVPDRGGRRHGGTFDLLARDGRLRR